ncbi:MAG: 3-deoxy-D-manno-octulosonic acid transferase [Holosporales bacterium]
MIFKIYKVLSNFSAPIVRHLIKKRIKKGLEDPLRYKERYGIASQERPQTPVVWFHAASVGESLSLLPVIDLWKKNNPTDTILVTTVTKTSATILEKRLPIGAIHQYVPFDVYRWVANFLDYWQPKQLIMVESELWPNMLALCHHIPVHLLNARLSERSYHRWLKLGTYTKMIFEKIDHVYAQSEDDAQKYITLGARQVTVLPHLKYAANPLPYCQQTYGELKNNISKKVFVCISTHDNEEAQLIAAFKKKKADVLLVIIPRHIIRVDEIVSNIKDLTVSRRSNDPFPPKDSDIYIVDTMGDVGLFCALSDFAFVGGTLVPIGGHNPLEPLMLNNIVFVGPHTTNINNLIKELDGAIIQAPSADAIFDHLQVYIEKNDLAMQHLNTIKNDIAAKKQSIESALSPLFQTNCCSHSAY